MFEFELEFEFEFEFELELELELEFVFEFEFAFEFEFVGLLRARHAHPRQIAPLEMYLRSSRSKANQQNRSSTNRVESLSLSLNSV